MKTLFLLAAAVVTSFTFYGCTKSDAGSTTPPATALDYWTLNDTTYYGKIAEDDAGIIISSADSTDLHFCEFDFAQGGLPTRTKDYTIIDAFVSSGGYYQFAYDDTTNAILSIKNYLTPGAYSPYEKYESAGAPGEIMHVNIAMGPGPGSSIMTLTFSNVSVHTGYGQPTTKVSGKLTNYF